jgi:hypothetical protein
MLFPLGVKCKVGGPAVSPIKCTGTVDLSMSEAIAALVRLGT